jgi:uncharacterized protein YndB with AHSA1/START domain
MGESARQIVITRVVDASRERVWEAWVKPEELMKWFYASEGWTTPFAQVDVRPNGAFSIGFQSPDRKSDFAFEGVYNEVIPPEKIVLTIGDGRPVSVVFDEEEGKTKITLTLTLEDLHSEEQQREGWTAMLVHLGEYLEREIGTTRA